MDFTINIQGTNIFPSNLNILKIKGLFFWFISCNWHKNDTKLDKKHIYVHSSLFTCIGQNYQSSNAEVKTSTKKTLYHIRRWIQHALQNLYPDDYYQKNRGIKNKCATYQVTLIQHFIFSVVFLVPQHPTVNGRMPIQLQCLIVKKQVSMTLYKLVGTSENTLEDDWAL